MNLCHTRPTATRVALVTPIRATPISNATHQPQGTKALVVALSAAVLLALHPAAPAHATEDADNPYIQELVRKTEKNREQARVDALVPSSRPTRSPNFRLHPCFARSGRKKCWNTTQARYSPTTLTLRAQCRQSCRQRLTPGKRSTWTSPSGALHPTPSSTRNSNQLVYRNERTKEREDTRDTSLPDTPPRSLRTHSPETHRPAWNTLGRYSLRPISSIATARSSVRSTFSFDLE